MTLKYWVKGTFVLTAKQSKVKIGEGQSLYASRLFPGTFVPMMTWLSRRLFPGLFVPENKSYVEHYFPGLRP